MTVEDKAYILLFFRQAPIAEAVKVLAEASGIVESRRIEEHFQDDEG